MSIKIKRHSIWDRYVYSFEPISKKIGYSLEGYSHRERCRVPDRKKLETEKMKKLR
jgi:hypothetical protein